MNPNCCRSQTHADASGIVDNGVDGVDKATDKVKHFLVKTMTASGGAASALSKAVLSSKTGKAATSSVAKAGSKAASVAKSAGSKVAKFAKFLAGRGRRRSRTRRRTRRRRRRSSRRRRRSRRRRSRRRRRRRRR